MLFMPEKKEKESEIILFILVLFCSILFYFYEKQVLNFSNSIFSFSAVKSKKKKNNRKSLSFFLCSHQNCFLNF